MGGSRAGAHIASTLLCWCSSSTSRPLSTQLSLFMGKSDGQKRNCETSSSVIKIVGYNPLSEMEASATQLRQVRVPCTAALLKGAS